MCISIVLLPTCRHCISMTRTFAQSLLSISTSTSIQMQRHHTRIHLHVGSYWGGPVVIEMCPSAMLASWASVAHAVLSIDSASAPSQGLVLALVFASFPNRRGQCLLHMALSQVIFLVHAITNSFLRVYTSCIEQVPDPTQEEQLFFERRGYSLPRWRASTRSSRASPGGSPRLRQHRSCTLCSHRCRIDSGWGKEIHSSSNAVAV